jgi:transmembrane sensor
MVMTEPNPFAKGQLRREAADWFLKMREPDADAHREAFEAWLARGAMHRSAYNSIAQTYLIAQGVDWDRIPAPRPVRGTVLRTRFAIAASVMLVGFLAWRLISGVPFPLPRASSSEPSQGASHSQMQVATRLGEIRQIRLSDGSRLTLDTDTLVSVDFRGDERELRVEHGRARFEVAHEMRPFKVEAAESEVVAHGTVFDVSLIEDRDVNVHLLSGKVEVRRRHDVGAKTLTEAVLRPGDEVRLTKRDGRLARPVTDDEDSTHWPIGSADYSRADLGEVVTAANRYSTTKIRLSGPELSRLQVSGVFRVNEPEKLALSLAQLFGLRVVRSPNELVLAPK